MFQQKNKVEYT